MEGAPMKDRLWSHQYAAILPVVGALEQNIRAGLWVQPTGTGKTLGFLTLAAWPARPTLVLVYRDELIGQTLKASAEVWPHAVVGVIQGPRDEWQGRDLVVASIQSLTPRRLGRIPKTRFDLVVVDDPHHLPAWGWSRAVAHFDPIFLLGVTATPDRLDGKGLAPWFGPKPLFEYTLPQAVADGILAPVRQLTVRTHINLDAVRFRGGDFAVGDLSKAVATAGRDRAVVEAFQAHAPGRRAVAFIVDRAHAHGREAAFAKAGVSAVALTGDLPLVQRRQTLADFAAGKFRVLTNCEVCTEGFDDPAIDCVVMARPTRSRALYRQCVGRGLRRRPAAGKTNCLILDVTDNCRKHKLVKAADLFGTPTPPAAAPAPAARPWHGGPNPSAAPAAPDVPVSWSVEEVRPWRGAPSLDGYRAAAGWQDHPATQRQLVALERFGLSPPRPLTKGEAGHLLSEHIRRAEERPSRLLRVDWAHQAGY